jgi:hypothetical protein
MTAKLTVNFAGSVVVPETTGNTTALLLGGNHCPSLAVDVATIESVCPSVEPIAQFVDSSGRQIAIFDLTGHLFSLDGRPGTLSLGDRDHHALRLDWLLRNKGVKGDPAKETYPGVAGKVRLDRGTLTAIKPEDAAPLFAFPYLKGKRRIASFLRWTVSAGKLPTVVLMNGAGQTTFQFRAACARAEVAISALCGPVTAGKRLDVEPWEKLFGARITAPVGESTERVKNIYTCPPLFAPIVSR